MPKAKSTLSQKDLKSICDAAQSAWDTASKSTKKVTFVWEGRRYQSRLTNMRMLVETVAGDPVAARYH